MSAVCRYKEVVTILEKLSDEELLLVSHKHIHLQICSKTLLNKT